MLSVYGINKLEAQNKCLRKQNSDLETTFLEILKIVNEPADNVAIVEFQNRIKAVLNGKNNG